MKYLAILIFFVSFSVQASTTTALLAGAVAGSISGSVMAQRMNKTSCECKNQDQHVSYDYVNLEKGMVCSEFDGGFWDRKCKTFISPKEYFERRTGRRVTITGIESSSGSSYKVFYIIHDVNQ